MASSSDYLEYALNILREVSDVTYRKMMGEYLLYSEGILFDGIYDDRLLLKDAPASRAAFPSEEVPYEGAGPMLLVDCEDSDFIASVIDEMKRQLPKPKPRKR